MLQTDVKYLLVWSQGALMSFNTDKCVVVRLHLRQARDNYIHYQLNGEPLRRVSHQHNLGLMKDEACKPHRQCAKAAKSANSIMRAIKASYMNITPTFFIHPHKEYSFEAWRPWLKSF